MIAQPPIAPAAGEPPAATARTATTSSVRRTRLPGDAFNLSTTDLPQRQRDALRWLHSYGDAQKLTNKALGELIGYSESTLSRLFSSDGISYAGNLDEVAAAIEAAQARLSAQHAALLQLRTGRIPFIKAELTHTMWGYFDASHEYGRIVYMYGDAQIGKSRNCKEYKAANMATCEYVEMPVRGALSNFLANIGDACRISTQSGGAYLRRRVINFFKDGNTRLIIDQVHRLFLDDKGQPAKELTRAQLDTLDFIIEMYDAAEHGFGLSLVGSNVMREGFQAIANKNFFRQIRGRSLHPEGCQLPDMPSEGDLVAYAAHYGLAPAAGGALKVQTNIIEQYGLAVWLTRLHSASMLAAGKKRPMSWDDVVIAHAFFNSLSKAPVAGAAGKDGAK